MYKDIYQVLIDQTYADDISLIRTDETTMKHQRRKDFLYTFVK